MSLIDTNFLNDSEGPVFFQDKYLLYSSSLLSRYNKYSANFSVDSKSSHFIIECFEGEKKSIFDAPLYTGTEPAAMIRKYVEETQSGSSKTFSNMI